MTSTRSEDPSTTLATSPTLSETRHITFGPTLPSSEPGLGSYLLCATAAMIYQDGLQKPKFGMFLTLLYQEVAYFIFILSFILRLQGSSWEFWNTFVGIVLTLGFFFFFCLSFISLVLAADLFYSSTSHFQKCKKICPFIIWCFYWCSYFCLYCPSFCKGVILMSF
jgi:hypothetical protein